MTIIVRTVSEQVYQVVRERILSGDFSPGAPLRQDAIAEDLGVSKIPLREALTRLEQDGLLSSSPNKGFVVRSLSAAEAEEVFELRLRLEPAATAQASQSYDEAGREAAVAAFHAVEDSADAVLANRRFHLALLRPGAGLVTSQIVERLHVLAERYVRVHLQPVGRASRAALEHQDILDAWLARDADRVADLIACHIRWTLSDLRAELMSDESKPESRGAAAYTALTASVPPRPDSDSVSPPAPWA